MAGSKIEDRFPKMNDLPSSRNPKNNHIAAHCPEAEGSQLLDNDQSKEIKIHPSRSRSVDPETIQLRNPVIVMQRIFRLAYEIFKDFHDSQKEINCLKTREWDFLSKAQSNNYKEGESLQSWYMGAIGIKAFSDALADWIGGDGLFDPDKVWGPIPKEAVTFINTRFENYISKTGFQIVGNISDGYGKTLFQNQEIQNRIKGSIKDCEIGQVTMDSQQGSQQAASDKEKLYTLERTYAELVRLAAQITTGQPV